MGTRHVIIIRKKKDDGKDILVGFYGQYDGYVSCCGVIIQQFLRDIAVEGNEEKFLVALLAAKACENWNDDAVVEAMALDHKERERRFPEICNKGAHLLTMLMHGKHEYLNRLKKADDECGFPHKEGYFSTEGVSDDVKFFVNEYACYTNWDCEWKYFLDLDSREITVMTPIALGMNVMKKVFSFDEFIELCMTTLNEAFDDAKSAAIELIVPDRWIKKTIEKKRLSNQATKGKYNALDLYMKNKLNLK